MSMRLVRSVSSLSAIGIAAALSLSTGSVADGAAKYHQCKGKGKEAELYPWVSGVHGITTNKACSTIVALGRAASGGSFPSLESLVTCGPAPTDASGAQTGPGTATLTRTTWHSWTLSYSTNAGLKLSRHGASFSAGQQDFGCY